MSKAPSVETQLRNATRELKELRRDVNTLRRERQEMFQRATASEKEVREWKERFDVLLKLRGMEPKP